MGELNPRPAHSRGPIGCFHASLVGAQVGRGGRLAEHPERSHSVLLARFDQHLDQRHAGDDPKKHQDQNPLGIAETVHGRFMFLTT
jgi:hypothetical protein